MEYVGKDFGLLLMDKPAGLTSHDVVNVARRALGTKAIGHTGTLDPFATGLLVLATGRATKLMPYLEKSEKTYEAVMVLGLTTDTLDMTGAITEESDCLDLSDESISDSIQGFIGPMKQKVPAYSAVKKDGKKMYEYARKGQNMPDIPAREIMINNISVKNIQRNNNGKIEVSFETSVSKGTYIRQLAYDIGQRLKTPACLKELRRIKVGAYSIEDAFNMDELAAKEFRFSDPLDGINLPELVVSKETAGIISDGGFLDTDLFGGKTDTVLRDRTGKPLAIYRFDKERNVMRMAVKLL